MFIQKIFHIRRGLQETKSALTKIHSYGRQLEGVRTAVITADGAGQFDCEFPSGFRAHCVLVELPTEDENQTLFQSTAGNMEVSGLVEFIPIRDNLTEVQLTMECSFKSAVHGFLDIVTNGAEHFFNRQLGRLETWLSSPAFSSHSPESRFGAHLPRYAHS